MDVPEFVDLAQNAEEKTATLSVRDPNAKEQKEMWGTFLNFYPCCFKLSSRFWQYTISCPCSLDIMD